MIERLFDPQCATALNSLIELSSFQDHLEDSSLCYLIFLSHVVFDCLVLGAESVTHTTQEAHMGGHFQAIFDFYSNGFFAVVFPKENSVMHLERSHVVTVCCKPADQDLPLGQGNESRLSSSFLLCPNRSFKPFVLTSTFQA